ncbi:hypothetical protein [Bacillus cereus]|uniref:hypothetical protein n=1 Tax=Bacillus cereus TaxID=1396 RepID=UPI003981107E
MGIRKEVISFCSFISGLYRIQEKKERSYHSLNPVAFLHMTKPVLDTYIALGIMGSIVIGGVMLEKYLIQSDYTSAARWLSHGLFHGIRIGGLGFIGYVFIRIVMMF